jgi:WD40 repeat protein
MNPLAAALQILDGAEPHASRAPRTEQERWEERNAAMALAEEQAGMAAGIASSSMSVAEEAVARFLARRSHLILRGGVRAHLREALSEPEGSLVRRMAEELRREGAAAAGGATVPSLLAVRRGGTRPGEDGRVRTLESRAQRVGQVAFFADGEYVCAFAWGSAPWVDGGGDSTFLQWRVATGERVAEFPAGQFREESGSFAISPDLRLLAVRDHRSIAVYDLERWRAEQRGGLTPRWRRRPAELHKLQGAEGPYAITFLDAEHLVADDSSRELAVWNAITGVKVASSSSMGWSDHAVARRSRRLLVAGSSAWARRAVATHALPSLQPLGAFSDAGGPVSGGRTQAIDVSPDERWVATGEEGGAVMAWSMGELEDPERRSSPRDPLQVRARWVGQHRDQVVTVRFIDERRLLSGGWDGVVLCWELQQAEALDAAAEATPSPPRSLQPPEPLRRFHGHLGWITSIDVHPQRHLAASAAEDGRVILWDLQGRGESPRGPVPPLRQERSLRPHPDGVEVLTDGVSTIVARPPGFAYRGPPLPQDPELIGINLDGYLVVPADEPEQPRLLVYPASAPLTTLEDDRGHRPTGEPADLLELELRGAGLCALDPRSFALVEDDGHVSFWELSP